jgi:GNAT superfamily N-acetyltransferase
MTVQIRQATLQDYLSIAAIARESQELHAQGQPTIFRSDTPGFSEEYLRHLIEDEASDAYVAEEDGHIVGYVFLHVRQVSFLDFFHPQTVALISDIAVTASARRKGIGRLLFDATLQWARNRNADRLELTVWEFNAEAITFYERNGMQTLNRTMSLPLT